MVTKNDKKCSYCEKIVRTTKMGNHMLKYHKLEVIEGFKIYCKVKCAAMPTHSIDKSYSLCFTCGAYFSTVAGMYNSKPCKKHIEKCNLQSQYDALKIYCESPVDAVTLMKQAQEDDIIELSVSEEPPLPKIEDVKPTIVAQKKKPVEEVILYKELPVVNNDYEALKLKVQEQALAIKELQNDCEEYIDSLVEKNKEIEALKKVEQDYFILEQRLADYDSMRDKNIALVKSIKFLNRTIVDQANEIDKQRLVEA